MSARDVFTAAYCLGILFGLIGFAGTRLSPMFTNLFSNMMEMGVWIFVLAVVFSWIYSFGEDGKADWDRHHG